MSLQTNHVPADNASEIGRLNFIIKSAMSGLRTAMPVKVLSVTNSGGVSPVGYLSAVSYTHLTLPTNREV